LKLWKLFEELKDPRKPSGRRYDLGSILKLLTAGLMCGRKSLTQIVLWGRSLGPKSLESLGFKDKIPCAATLSNLLKRIDINAVESALSLNARGGKKGLAAGTHLALDGKTLRATHQEGVPLVHLLSIFVTKTQAVWGQVKMKEGENEICAATRLLSNLDLKDVIVTGDAIFAQKNCVL
jgi:hypothetical protein